MLLFSASFDIKAENDFFTQLYDDFHNDMLKYARFILRNNHDAEDVVGDAYVKILKHIEKFKSVSFQKRRGLLSIIVRNSCYDLLRRHRRVHEISFEDWMQSEEGERYASSGADEEPYINLFAAINKLEPMYGGALELKYVYGFSYAEMASLLDISQDVARQRVSRGIKMLKMRMEEEPDGE